MSIPREFVITIGEHGIGLMASKVIAGVRYTDSFYPGEEIHVREILKSDVAPEPVGKEEK